VAFVENPVTTPGLSVIVCCYNSEAVIVPTIKALSEQEIPEHSGFEVILVDNGCTDKTVELAGGAWNMPGLPLRVVKELRPGLIYARMTGARQARYETLLFADDDNILAPGWFARLQQIYRQMPGVGAVVGYNEPLIQGEKPFWFDQFMGVYACGPRDEGSGRNPRKLFGAGTSFRTDLLRAVLFSGLPLFLIGRTKNRLFRGEDTEIALRCRLLGWDLFYDECLRLRHNLPASRLTWDYVRRARKAGGEAFLILTIYQNLLEGGIPPDFSGQVRQVCQNWKSYFQAYKKRPLGFRKEGTTQSARFYRLWGETRGLWLFRKTYDSIRMSILDSFRKTRRK
jgi:glycosyltransferase involved in cell wall biosynthesis